MKEILKQSKIGTNPDSSAYDLGGFGMFDKNWDSVDTRFMVESSEIIENRSKCQNNVSKPIIRNGFALLHANEKDTTVNTVLLKSNKFAEMTEGGKVLQADFIKPLITVRKLNQ